MGPEGTKDRFLRQALARGADCLSVEKLELCLAGEAPNEFSSHLASCAHCQAELELLRAFYAVPRDAEEAEAVREITQRLRAPRTLLPAEAGSSWWRRFLQARWLSPAALAAAALLIVTAVGLELRHGSAPRIEAPNRPEDNVLRSGRVTLVSPVGDLASAPEQVQWRPVEGAAKYEVRLFEVDRSEVWRDSTPGLWKDIPPTVRARMVPAKPFLLQVAAFDAAGRQLAESELVRFRILRKVYSR